MRGVAPRASAIFRATASETRRRSASMSISAIVESRSSGKLSRSPMIVFANTVEPAPTSAIFIPGRLLHAERIAVRVAQHHPCAVTLGPGLLDLRAGGRQSVDLPLAVLGEEIKVDRI